MMMVMMMMVMMMMILRNVNLCAYIKTYVYVLCVYHFSISNHITLTFRIENLGEIFKP